jgi:ABC-2 type transport system permease protein
MTGALFFLHYHSLKNRTLVRLRRLRQPKYLVGAIVGGLYFYFYFFRYLFGLPARRAGLELVTQPGNIALHENIGAALFLIAILLAWVLPHERAALAFTEAEVAFLFPAPITRRGLIHFKLLRSQAAILFTTLVLMLVTRRFGGNFLIRAAGWWLILSTLNLHLLGSSFARTTLMDKGITPWWRRLIIFGAAVLVALTVLLWVRRTLPAFQLSEIKNIQALQDYFQTVLTSGPLPYLLYPFRLIVRPYMAVSGIGFLKVLGPALALLLVHYWWVTTADTAFEEASVEASRKVAEKVNAIRSGNLHSVRGRNRRRRAPFTLNSDGSPVVALLWKNLISAGQTFTPRLWLMLATSALIACAVLARTAEDSSLVSGFGMVAGMLVAWSLFIGPQILRQDLRQDLALSDVLKQYPVCGWEMVLGELLAPVAILTGVQWLLLLTGGVLLFYAPTTYLSRSAVICIGACAALIVPLLNLILFQIPNAAVVLFPAWFQTGKDRTAGIEVTGQRIIAIVAQLLVFVVTIIPASIGFAAVFLVVQKVMLGKWVAIVLGAAMASLILAFESALGIMALGRLFDRLDISAELPP